MAYKPNGKKRVPKFNDEQLKKTLSSANGIQARAAEALKVSRSIVCERIARSPALQAHMKQLVEDRIDRAEQALDNLLADNNTTACIFTLKTIGRSRGYIEHAPLEEVDSAKLKALGDFFASIGTKPSKQPDPISSEPAGPDSSLGKTSHVGTNFP